MEQLGQMSLELFFGFIALLVATKFLGKTQISQLSPFDFVSSLVLGELVGNSVYDPDVSIWFILYALTLWTILLYTVEKLTQKFRGLRGAFEGNPSIIIRQGEIDRNELKANNLDINQLQQLLRQEKDIFSFREVEYLILEPNGQISVLKKPKYDSPTIEDLSLKQKPVSLPITLISDGKVDLENLRTAGYDEEWLLKQIKKKGVTQFEDVLFAEWKDNDGFFCLKMNKK